MYLMPQTSNLQEFKERLRNHEVFRVFKRPVSEKTKDRTFKRHGRSNVTLEDGTEVIVKILDGRIVDVQPLNSPTEHFPFDLREEKPLKTIETNNESFAEMQAKAKAIEARILGESTRKEEEDAWNEVYENLHLEIPYNIND